MRKRSLGRTLTFALDETRKVSLPQVRFPSSVLANKIRLKLFQDACRCPCISSSSLARMNALSKTNARWHLEVLHRANYVSAKKLQKETVFFPKEFIREKDETDIEILSLLNKEIARRLFVLILERPGISLGSLRTELNAPANTCAWYLRRLNAYGLISSVADGRSRRYYPLPLFLELRKKNKGRLKKFRRHMIERLSGEGFAPKIVRETEGRITFATTFEGKEELLTLSTDPYMSILEGI